MSVPFALSITNELRKAHSINMTQLDKWYFTKKNHQLSGKWRLNTLNALLDDELNHPIEIFQRILRDLKNFQTSKLNWKSFENIFDVYIFRAKLP